jgi:predicted nucleotidyltransferase
MNVLLAGVVGSTAYGLAHEGSDVDVLGMFAAPTEEWHGLCPPRESLVGTDPDRTFHEAGKALRLLLGSNPTVSELLWLERYDVRTPLGDELVGLRGSLLSERGVRDAYLGYAGQQFRKLLTRGPDVRGRAAKHARHLVRLLRQAEQLHRTGALTVRLDDPGEVRRCSRAGECCRTSRTGRPPTPGCGGCAGPSSTDAARLRPTARAAPTVRREG